MSPATHFMFQKCDAQPLINPPTHHVALDVAVTSLLLPQLLPCNFALLVPNVLLSALIHFLDILTFHASLCRQSEVTAHCATAAAVVHLHLTSASIAHHGRDSSSTDRDHP